MRAASGDIILILSPNVRIWKDGVLAKMEALTQEYMIVSPRYSVVGTQYRRTPACVLPECFMFRREKSLIPIDERLFNDFYAERLWYMADKQLGIA